MGHYNKSCSKAHEHLGAIAEREQAYEDAADSYSKAWDIDNGNNPTVGFKLAFNHMKAKRFVEAIDVGNEVLAKYPQYPRMPAPAPRWPRDVRAPWSRTCCSAGTSCRAPAPCRTSRPAHRAQPASASPFRTPRPRCASNWPWPGA